MPPEPPRNSGSEESSPASYSLLLTGEVLDGFETDSVVAWLAQTLKISRSEANALLSGRSRCIKRNLDRTTAARFQASFEAHGVSARIAGASQPVNRRQPPGVAEQTSAPEIAPTQVIASTSAFHGSFSQKPLARSTGLALGIALSATVFVCLLYLLLTLGSLAAALVVLSTGVLHEPPLTSAPLVGLYLLPALLLFGFFVLLLRPVFAQQNPHRLSLEIEMAKHGKLLLFVREIFQQMGAAAPEVIRVNYENKVSAEYHCSPPRVRSGFNSLTLGMPLIATLRSPQLAALIAAQASQLRKPLLACVFKACRRVQLRFEDCAENQDLWARRLEAHDIYAMSAPRRAVHVLLDRLNDYSAFLFKPFALLLNTAGRWSNRYAVQAADHSACAFIGTRHYVETFRQLAIAREAMHLAEERMFDRVGERQLVNNIPALVQHYAGLFSEKEISNIEDAMHSSETRHEFDYPADRERIIFVEDLELEGITCADFPASELFTSTSLLNEQITLLYYQNMQLQVKPSELVDVVQLANLADKDQKREKLSAQYFNNWFQPHAFWRIPAPDSIRHLRQSERLARLNELVGQIRHTTPDYHNLLELESKHLSALVNTGLASEIQRAGYRFEPAEFNLSAEQARHLNDFHGQNRKEYEGLRHRLVKLQELMGGRLFLAVALHPDAAKRKAGVMLLQMLATLQQQDDRLASLAVRVSYLPMLVARQQEKKEPELGKRVQRITSDVNQYCAEALRSLGQYKCTFNHAYENLAGYLKAHLKQQPEDHQLQPLEAVAYYSEMVFGLCETNRAINNQVSMIAMESELLNKVDPVKLASSI